MPRALHRRRAAVAGPRPGPPRQPWRETGRSASDALSGARHNEYTRTRRKGRERPGCPGMSEKVGGVMTSKHQGGHDDVASLEERGVFHFTSSM